MIPVSIVIPVHNGGEQFRACLKRVALSTAKPFEIIVVDDGSTDGSGEAARSFGATVIETDGQRGPAYARNLGATRASGAILFFFDADVDLHVYKIGRVAEEFKSDQNRDALIGGTVDGHDDLS